MLIKTKLKAVRSAQFHRKVFEAIMVLESAHPHYPKQYQGLSHQKLAYFRAYDIPEMNPIYNKWSGLSKHEPDDYFPAYCRLRCVFELIDLNQKEIPLIDPQGRPFRDDLEFLCFADLSKLQTYQDALDLLGVDSQVLPQQ